jgi:DNA polymerase III delta prime subunit
MRDDVLKVIDHVSFAHIVLIGSSGCGKTTTSLMVAKERFCVFLECWDGEGWRLPFYLKKKKLVGEIEIDAIQRRFKREMWQDVFSWPFCAKRPTSRHINGCCSP